MVGYQHERTTALGTIVQGEQGCVVSHDHAHPGGGDCTVDCRIWFVCGKEADGCYREEGQSCYVVKRGIIDDGGIIGGLKAKDRHGNAAWDYLLKRWSFVLVDSAWCMDGNSKRRFKVK